MQKLLQKLGIRKKYRCPNQFLIRSRVAADGIDWIIENTVAGRVLDVIKDTQGKIIDAVIIKPFTRQRGLLWM